MNQKTKEKLNLFINKHIIAIGIVFYICIVPITMGIREIKIAIGIPDQRLNLENKNSQLPDLLIHKNDLSSNWKFRSISTSQYNEARDDKLIESAYRMFMGTYKTHKIILTSSIDHYIAGLNMIHEREAEWHSFAEPDKYITIDILQTFYNPVLDIQTYCYNKHYIVQNSNETECRMYKIEDQYLIIVQLEVYDVTEKSVYMEVVAEMEKLMK